MDICGELVRFRKCLDKFAVILVMLIKFVFLEYGFRSFELLEQDEVLFINTIILNFPVYIVE